jgi:hypothetical protein
MLDRPTLSPADELLGRLNAAVAVCNDAERRVTTAQTELVSRSRAVGTLLLEAKRLHPKVADFVAFLKRVEGLQLSRAYDYLRIAGGRVTDEELREEARIRKEKSREKKKAEAQAMADADALADAVIKKIKPPPKPGADSVTKPDVTEKGKSEAQPVFDSPQEAHAKEKPQGLALGALTVAWRNVEAAAAAGNKTRLKAALQNLRVQVTRTLKSGVLK